MDLHHLMKPLERALSRQVLQVLHSNQVLIVLIVYELEKYLRQWENLLQDRQDDMPGSVKTLKDIRKLMQYVFSSSSPIHHIILKRPLSGIIAFTLDEVCKKNASRWLQYTNGSLHGMSQQDLDSILYSSIRKNYSSLMKIVNLVLEDSHVASLILKA